MASKSKYFTQISNFLDYVLVIEKDEVTGELLVSRLTPIEKDLFRQTNRYAELFECSTSLAIKMNISEGALTNAKRRIQLPTVQFGKPLMNLRKEKTAGGGKDYDNMSNNIDLKDMTKMMRPIVKFCAEYKRDPYLQAFKQCGLSSNRTTPLSEFITSLSEFSFGQLSLSRTSLSVINNNHLDSSKNKEIKNNQKIADCGDVENSSSFQQTPQPLMNDSLAQSEGEGKEEFSYQEKIDIMKTWSEIKLNTPTLKNLGGVPWKELIYCKEATLRNNPNSPEGYFISLIKSKAYQKAVNCNVNRQIALKAAQEGKFRSYKMMKSVFRPDASDKHSSINLELPPETFSSILEKWL